MAGVNNGGANGPRGRAEATVRTPERVGPEQEDTRREPTPAVTGRDGDTVVDRRQMPRAPDHPTQKTARPVDATVIVEHDGPARAEPTERTAVTVRRPHPAAPSDGESPPRFAAPSRAQWLALGLLALLCCAVVVGAWLFGRFG